MRFAFCLRKSSTKEAIAFSRDALPMYPAAMAACEVQCLLLSPLEKGLTLGADFIYLEIGSNIMEE